MLGLSPRRTETSVFLVTTPPTSTTSTTNRALARLPTNSGKRRSSARLAPPTQRHPFALPLFSQTHLPTKNVGRSQTRPPTSKHFVPALVVRVFLL